MRRKPIVQIALVCALGILASTAANGQSVDMPVRRSGLWALTYTDESGKAARPDKFCSDANIEKKNPQLAMGTPMNFAFNCARNMSFQRTEKGLEFKAVCPFTRENLATSYTYGTATGDFQSSYHVDFVSRVVSHTKGVTQNHHLVIDGLWLGPCPIGIKPGDFVSWSGHVVHQY